MLCKALPKISILTAICVCLIVQTALGQTKPAGEVDITKCWAYSLGDEGGSHLASDGTRVYIGAAGATVEALSVDGKKMWLSELGGEINSNLLSTEGGLFLVTATVAVDGARPTLNILRSLSRETGVTTWTANLADAGEHFLYPYKDGVVIVSKNGIIQLIDAKGGALRWKREIAEGFSAKPAFRDDKLIVATTAKQVFLISLPTGEIEWMRKMQFDISALSQTGGSKVLMGDDRGNLTSFAGSAEKPYWKFKSGAEVSNIFMVGDHILMTSHDNFVYSISTGNGGVVWKRRLTGRVTQISTFLDRFALISSVDGHDVVLVDIITGKIAGQIALTAEENLTYKPVVVGGFFFAVTDQSAYAYSLNGCGAKKEGDPDK